VGALQHVDRVDLEEAQPVDDPADVTSRDLSGKPRAWPGEALRGQSDPTGLQDSQPSRLWDRSHGMSSTSLLRTAYMAASIRDFICSFSRMLRMWFLTVFSLMNSSSAISRLLSPRAT
jgi:hypothetical protein